MLTRCCSATHPYRSVAARCSASAPPLPFCLPLQTHCSLPRPPAQSVDTAMPDAMEMQGCDECRAVADALLVFLCVLVPR